MESFGRILQEEREKRGLDLDTVVKETSIVLQYVVALENEKLEVFPGEPYAIGFLRNYAEYLGLDSANIIALFHAKKIQEAPTPLELYKPNRPAYLIPVVIAVAVTLMLGIAALLWFLLRSRNDTRQGAAITNTTDVSAYRLSADPLIKRVYRGDVLAVPVSGGEDIQLTVKDTLSSLTFATPIGDLIVELGEELELDIDGLPGAEIIVFVSDVSRTDASRGAEVRVTLKAPEEKPAESVVPVTTETALGRSTVLFEDNRAYPFVINAAFRGKCLLRYQTDRGDRIQDYYSSGAILTMQANNSIRLWVSNDTAVKLTLSADGKTHDLDISRLGRVVVCDVRWTRDSANVFRLVVTELD